MAEALWRSILVTLILLGILCGAYPLAVTGVGWLFFRDHATGGLIRDGSGRVVGAKLIGQAFTRPEYFHGRPSAAGQGYDAANSSGTNLGPTNPKLADALKANVDAVLKENPGLARGAIPVDMVTASASGLDPHISPENAAAQAPRVAAARGVPPEKILQFVRERIEGAQWGLFGEPVVNVLLINLDLDRLVPRH